MLRNGGRFTPEWVAGIGPESWPEWSGKRIKGLDKTEKNKNIVVYCEKIWVHRDDLAKFEQETKRTVRPMIVPFTLK